MGWDVGFEPDHGESVVLMEDVSFRQAMRHLEDHITICLDNMDEMDNAREEYETALADVRDITHDEGIMCDPNMWEDMDFYVQDGQFYVFQN